MRHKITMYVNSILLQLLLLFVCFCFTHDKINTTNIFFKLMIKRGVQVR